MDFSTGSANILSVSRRDSSLSYQNLREKVLHGINDAAGHQGQREACASHDNVSSGLKWSMMSESMLGIVTGAF